MRRSDPVGMITRGTTHPHRLRRCDRWLLATQAARGGFELPSVTRMLEELRTIVAAAAPTDAVFRTNHASNYLPLGGRLPHDRDRILAIVDRALAGGIALKPEWARGL